jgi:hypothetical protein
LSQNGWKWHGWDYRADAGEAKIETRTRCVTGTTNVLVDCFPPPIRTITNDTLKGEAAFRPQLQRESFPPVVFGASEQHDEGQSLGECHLQWALRPHDADHRAGRPVLDTSEGYRGAATLAPRGPARHPAARGPLPRAQVRSGASRKGWRWVSSVALRSSAHVVEDVASKSETATDG